ncbi:hypothetical protein [Streptomyces sp. NPDC092370]|uniref:hypothetical protein n=1 Tax=Streptomyces sp. NPDC092370 TaxID=3366016 RepID=UPI0038098300
MSPGIPARRSHDDVRTGTTTLFVALEVATEKVICSPHQRHQVVEFREFLAKAARRIPQVSMCT